MSTQSSSIYYDKSSRLSIDVILCGKGPQTIIVFPGGPALKKTYLINSIANFDQDQFQVYFLSTPGHEKAFLDNSPLSLTKAVKCYSAFIKDCIDGSFKGIGHSMGCWTLAAVTNTHDINSKSNLYISPSLEAAIPNELRDKFTSVKKSNPNISPESYLLKILEFYFLQPDGKFINDLIDPQSVTTEVIYDLNEGELKGLFNHPQNFRKDWAIFGQSDLLAGPTTRDTKFMNSMEKVTLIPDSAHFPMLENPKSFSDVLLEWIKKE